MKTQGVAVTWGVLALACGSNGSDGSGTTGNATAVTSTTAADTTAPASSNSSSNNSTGGSESGDPDSDESSSGSTTGGSNGLCVAVDDLAPQCREDWQADGECDVNNNAQECAWDGGDCCEASCDSGEFDCGAFGYDCRDPAMGGYEGMPIETIGNPCDRPADPFDPAAMESEVVLLSSDDLQGRAPGTRGDAITLDYIERRFECLDLLPAQDDCYLQAFYGEDGDRTANVVGVLPGSDPAVASEIIVVGGHHDHLGVQDFEIYNGANDNVSGIVGLFAIAQSLSTGPAPRRTIVFVAFGAEEYGLLGSDYYANNPPADYPTQDVVYMVNLDMLGTYDVVNGVDAFGSFDGTPGRAALDALLPNYPGLDVTLGVASPEG